MRSWQRASAGTLCGGCRNREIVRGEPVLHIVLPGVRRPLVRCQDCAGEAPPEMPAQMEPGGIQSSKIGFSRAADAAPARTRGALREMVERYRPQDS